MILLYCYISDEFFRHKKSRECQTGKQRRRRQRTTATSGKDDDAVKHQLEDMSHLVQTNLLSTSSKHNLQLETDEAAVISLLANQLSQQQTQLTGPVLQEEGNYFWLAIFLFCGHCTLIQFLIFHFTSQALRDDIALLYF